VRRFSHLLVAGAAIAGSLAFLAVPAIAQTADLPAFCDARMRADDEQSKKETRAVLDEMVAAAPDAVRGSMTDLRDLFAKKGNRAFESKRGSDLLAEIEPYVYDNCPGQKVAVTALDYAFQGVPATLPAGVTKFRLSNTAPEEQHEIAIVKVLLRAENRDPTDILGRPDKKLGKFVDFSNASGAFAPPGETGYTVMELEPGKYLYACFVPVDGERGAKAHWERGMYGTFVVP
jgi:hypothetical protein